MAQGGYRANAGRPKGAKSAATIEREMTAAAERLREQGTRSDLAVMLEIRDYWMGVASKEQADFKKLVKKHDDAELARTNGDVTVVVPEKPEMDHELMSKALTLAGEMASKRAPFLHARLQSVAITQQPWDLTKLSDAELDVLERLQRKSAAGIHTGGESPTSH